MDWPLLLQILFVLIAIFGAIFARIFARRRRSPIRRFYSEIDRTYRTFESDAPRCESALMSTREQIVRAFEEGRITNEQFVMLDRTIAEYVERARAAS